MSLCRALSFVSLAVFAAGLPGCMQGPLAYRGSPYAAYAQAYPAPAYATAPPQAAAPPIAQPQAYAQPAQSAQPAAQPTEAYAAVPSAPSTVIAAPAPQAAPANGALGALRTMLGTRPRSQPAYQQVYQQQTYQQPVYQAAAQPAYGQTYGQQTHGQQVYGQQVYSQPAYAQPAAGASAPQAAPAAALNAQAQAMPMTQAQPVSAPAMQAYRTPYVLDAGDKLRIIVFGQEGLTNSYTVDASGHITMPLIGAVAARGLTPAELAQAVTARLRNGFVRDPQVAAEVETYRPFFILGEVTAPGQYPYVPNMTASSAVAIAGGFSARAQKQSVQLSRPMGGGVAEAAVPLNTPIMPGDTLVVRERWF